MTTVLLVCLFSGAFLSMSGAIPMEPNSNLFNQLFHHSNPSEQALSQTANLYSGARQGGAELPARWAPTGQHSSWYDAQGRPIAPVDPRMQTLARFDHRIDPTWPNDRRASSWPAVPSNPTPQQDQHPRQIHTPAWRQWDAPTDPPVSEHNRGGNPPGVETGSSGATPFPPFATLEDLPSADEADELDRGPESWSPRSLQYVQEAFGVPAQDETLNAPAQAKESSSSAKKRKGKEAVEVETLRTPRGANPHRAVQKVMIEAPAVPENEPAWLDSFTQRLEGATWSKALSEMGRQYFRATRPAQATILRPALRKIRTDVQFANAMQMALVRKILQLRLEVDLHRAREREPYYSGRALDMRWKASPTLELTFVSKTRPTELPSSSVLDLQPLKAFETFVLGDYVVVLKASDAPFARAAAKTSLANLKDSYDLTVVAWPIHELESDESLEARHPILVGVLKIRAADETTGSSSTMITARAPMVG